MLASPLGGVRTRIASLLTSVKRLIWPEVRWWRVTRRIVLCRIHAAEMVGVRGAWNMGRWGDLMISAMCEERLTLWLAP